MTVIQVIAEIALITAAILIGNIITDGALIPLITGTADAIQAANKFANFLASLFQSDMAKGVASLFVQDAIITPQGQVIKTAPDDYIMAMRNPQNLPVGEGGGITNNYYISAIDSQSMTDAFVRNPQAMATGVGNAIGRRNLVLSTRGKAIGATY